MLNETAISNWGTYHQTYLNDFEESLGGIVGIMMNDDNKLFYDLLKEMKLIDCYKRETIEKVPIAGEVKEEIFADSLIKVSINNIVFTACRVRVINRTDIERKYYDFKNCFSGNRINIHDIQYSTISDILDIETENEPEINRKFMHFFFHDFKRLYGSLYQDNRGRDNGPTR